MVGTYPRVDALWYGQGMIPPGQLRDTARAIANFVHDDDLDKQGRPYFRHHLEPVARLARTLAKTVGLPDTETALVEAVAWLHDSVEDHHLTAEHFAAWGIPEVYPHVLRLSHNKSAPYQDYIAELCASGDITAIIVKLADNIVNSSTLDGLPEPDQERLAAKYTPAFLVMFTAFRLIVHPEGA